MDKPPKAGLIDPFEAIAKIAAKVVTHAPTHSKRSANQRFAEHLQKINENKRQFHWAVKHSPGTPLLVEVRSHARRQSSLIVIDEAAGHSERANRSHTRNGFAEMRQNRAAQSRVQALHLTSGFDVVLLGEIVEGAEGNHRN
jgi:hypothetical protein